MQTLLHYATVIGIWVLSVWAVVLTWTIHTAPAREAAILQGLELDRGIEALEQFNQVLIELEDNGMDPLTTDCRFKKGNIILTTTVKTDAREDDGPGEQATRHLDSIEQLVSEYEERGWTFLGDE